MNGDQIGINLTLAALVVFIGLIAFLWRQQRTIDKLTDKILGIQPTPKDKPTIVEDDASPPKETEPLSWHDN